MTRTARRLFVAAFFALRSSSSEHPRPSPRAASRRRCPGRWPIRRAPSSPAPASSSSAPTPPSTSEAVTNAEGQFTVPALNAGTYSVTVTLSGFKTVTVNDVVVNAGVPAGVKVTMEVGGIEEQVVVTGRRRKSSRPRRRRCRRRSASKQIQSLPLTSRNALRLRRQPAGRQHAGHGAQLDGQRPAAGLDQHHARRHLDPGQLPEDDRRLLRARPAAPRRDRGSHGHLRGQRRRQRRPGRGQHPLRHQVGHQQVQGQRVLHAAPRRAEREHVLQQPQPDAIPSPARRRRPSCGSTSRASTSAVRSSIPGLWSGHDKAFFFFNYEDSRTPSKITRNRVILTPAATAGRLHLRHDDGEPAAAGGGATARPRRSIRRSRSCSPTCGARAASGSIVNLSDPILQQATFQVDEQQLHAVSARPRRLQHQRRTTG